MMPIRLQDCDLFHDNEVNDDGDIIHLVLMDESESVKIEDALSGPKWICTMNEELESVEKNKTMELVDLPQGKKLIGYKMGIQSEGKSQR